MISHSAGIRVSPYRLRGASAIARSYVRGHLLSHPRETNIRMAYPEFPVEETIQHTADGLLESVSQRSPREALRALSGGFSRVTSPVLSGDPTRGAPQNSCEDVR